MEIKLQSHGTTIGQGLWRLQLESFARLPFVVMDLFVPLRPLTSQLSSFWAMIGSVGLFALLALLVIRYRHLPAVIFGSIFTIFGIMPTLFFQTTRWWDPLDSRYTYVPRLGVILVIAAIVSFHVLHNRSRSVIHRFALVLGCAILLQVTYMARATSAEYGYVYKTGRTLGVAATLLRDHPPSRVFIHAEHPFRENRSHLMGALNAIGGVSVAHMIFLEPGVDTYDQKSGDALLYWNPEARQYELTSGAYPYLR